MYFAVPVRFAFKFDVGPSEERGAHPEKELDSAKWSGCAVLLLALVRDVVVEAGGGGAFIREVENSLRDTYY